ncbi:MAG: RecQ family ATP-dependent DNA helicase [Armatimonadota bacterium]
MAIIQHPDGLTLFGLTIEEAKSLPRGKRRSLAGYLVRFGYYEQARDLLTHIVSADPNGMLYRMWLVWALLGCGDIEQSDSLSQQLLSEFPDMRGVILTRADVLFTQGEVESACEVMHTDTFDPKDGYSYWARLGLAFQRRSLWDEAHKSLDRAITIYRSRTDELEDKTIPIYLWMALALQEEHECCESREFRDEFGKLKQQEQDRLCAELEKPDRKTGSAQSHHRITCPDIPLKRTVDPEVAASMAAASEAPMLNAGLESQLKRFFGYDKFRKGQQQVVEHVLSDNSVLAIMPTGAGKSLCYQLPAMLLDGLTLVVSPLIALMKDQVDGLPVEVQKQATLINSTLDGDEIDRRLSDIRAGKYKLVYAAPERLRQIPFLHALRGRGVSLIVVDEAHCVSMWGHDFRPDYLFIGKALRYMGDPTVLAMTATATPKMRVEISNNLGRQLKVISTGTHRPNLYLESMMVRSDEEKMRSLIHLCRENDGAGIIYTRSRKKTEELAMLLRRERIRATHYHAGMDADDRARTHEEFMDGKWRVICATVAFGMGIDKSDVRFVIHYSLPGALEDYYQEAGRAGRDGLPSRCILLCTPSDKANNTRWMRQERVDADLPRKCYKIIRELTLDSPFAAIHSDDFERELGEQETKIRVAISMLEDIDLIRRHPDIPMTMTIGLTHKGVQAGGDELTEFAKCARLGPDQRVSIESMDLSRRAQLAPYALEEKLLDWQAEGNITYWGSGHMMLLERLPAPRDSKFRLDDLVSRYEKVQQRRIEEIYRYAEIRHCKHDIIADHFGEPPIENCLSCDVCSPSPESHEPISRQACPIESPLSDEQRRRKIIETVNMIPGRVGFTGLVRVLKGSITSRIKRDTCPNFGIFANLPKTAVERCVSEMLQDGSIRRDDSEYRLIWPADN